jgi:hypothetical protein
MAHFYGTVQGNRGEATRLGTRDSGMDTTAASWAGAIAVSLYVDEQGRDCYRISQRTHHGKGCSEPIACGVLGVPYDAGNDPLKAA